MKVDKDFREKIYIYMKHIQKASTFIFLSAISSVGESVGLGDCERIERKERLDSISATLMVSANKPQVLGSSPRWRTI